MSTNHIENRHCIRSFTNQEIPHKILENVLNQARHAPSSKNTQPWEVAILTGQSKDNLINDMLVKFDRNEFEKEDYQYMIDPLPDEFRSRARECGYGIYSIKGISRDDREARKAHFRENYMFFNAPVAIIFHLPLGSEKGNFMDMGFFIQNVMLGLVAHQLGSCPQFSICAYSNTIREHLKLKNRLIVCGMSVGYPNDTAIVNTFVPPRRSVHEFTTWFN